jgi:hypothetical protein
MCPKFLKIFYLVLIANYIFISCYDITFMIQAVTRHNFYRARHGVPALSLNIELSNLAQNYANKLAMSNTFQHSRNKWKGLAIGENIAWLVSTNKIDGASPTEMWYNEINNYNYNYPGFSMYTGHFSQVVWKNSYLVGLGVSRRGNKWYVVANYYPPGNSLNAFRQNVLPVYYSTFSTNPKKFILNNINN